MNWTAANIPDLQGKTYVITGANSGLGYETSLALACKGAKVVMACRNMEKAEQAASMIRQAVPAADLQILPLDLASLQSVSQFADTFGAQHGQLQALINNAGIMAIPRRETSDGFEMQFGTNHLGHFALTGHLMKHLMATPDARVVQVSSLAYAFGSIDFEDLNWEKSYKKWGAYGRSKLSNLLFALELDQRLQASGHKVRAMAAHPGYASTNLQTVGAKMEKSAFQERFFNLGNRLLAQSAEMGALPQLFAAIAPEANGGHLYGPRGVFGMRGYPHRDKIRPKKLKPEVMRRLFDVSQELTKVKFPV